MKPHMTETYCSVDDRVVRFGLLARVAALALVWAIAPALAQPPIGLENSAEPQEAPVDKRLTVNEPGAFQGYTLITPMQSTWSYLIDMEGRVVNSWKSDYIPGTATYFLENGHLLRASEKPDPEYGFSAASGGRIQEFDWDGELVWEYDFDRENRIQHHDIEPMPNGNVLLVVADRKSAEAAVAAGRNPDNVSETFRTDAIYEIKPTGPKSGEIVWSWHVWDHLIQDADPEKPNYGKVEDHPELININHTGNDVFAQNPAMRGFMNLFGGQGGGQAGGFGGGFGLEPDWTHFNSVAYNVELNQIAISAHGFNEIWIIDHSTTTEESAGHSGGRHGKGGDLIYRWGNPRAYGAGDQSDQKLFGQHDVQWIPKGLPGEGQILLFNNGFLRPDRQPISSVDELVPPVDEDGKYVREEGKPFGPEDLVWSYTAENSRDFFSWFISGAQRLPNGNTLICEGDDGRIFEVTPVKKIVWEYRVPPIKAEGMQVERFARAFAGFGGGRGVGFFGGGTVTFRAYRFGTDFPAFEGKDLTPGRPLSEVAPPPK